jgi:hypothetical protein
MAKEIKGARFVLKRSNVPGETPTIPPNNDHTSGLWIDTDIYSGEMFLNVADDKMWFRNASDTKDVATEMVQLVPLNSGGTIDTSYLPGNYLGAMVYQGTWDASTGNPPSTTPEKGDYWIVNVSGNTDLDGITDWQIGDFAIYNGTTWDKIDNSEPIIESVNVLYDHSYYTSLSNVKEGLDFLLDRFNYYSGSTNITLTDDGSGHGKTISLVANPSVTDLSSSSINNTGDLDVGGNLHVTGTTNLYSSLTSTSSIVANTLQTTSTLYFNTVSNRLETDGLGIRFYQGGTLRLEFDNTGIATSYSKLRYDSSKTLDNNLDMVNKEYLDNYVALHNVGLWSSGGTLLNDPYKIIAWDGINTYYVGIGIQNPLYNLDVVGNARISSTLSANGGLSVTGNFSITSSGDVYFNYNSSNGLTQIGDIDDTVEGNYLQVVTNDGGGNGLLEYYVSSSTVGYSVSSTLYDININTRIDGALDLNGSLDVSGGINLGSGGSNELILRGTHVTIANNGDATENIGLAFAASASFNDPIISILRSSTTRPLTIRGQNSTSGSGGRLNLYGGNGAAGTGDGGDIYIKGGDSPSGNDGGDLHLQGGSGTPGGFIYFADGSTQGVYMDTGAIPTGTPAASEILFVDTGSSNLLKRGTVTASPGGSNTQLQYNNSSSLGGTAGLTWNSSSRILTIAPASSTSQGYGTMRMGHVNYETSNTETDYLYSGFVHASDNWNITQTDDQGSLAVVMKHYKSGQSEYIYSHIAVNANGLRTKHNENAADSTAAGGGTWRVYPYLTNTLANNYIMTGVNGYSMQAESGLQYNGSTLSVTGAITATGNITAYYSDIRLKEEIKEIENPLDKILSLNGFTYRPNDLVKSLSPGIEDEQNIGLSAQELQKVLPEAVKLAPFDRDVDTGDSISGENYLTIQYEKLVPLLIEGMKEQQKLIEELQEKLK